MFFPQSENGVYTVVKKAPDERTDILPAQALWIDQYSGGILHRLDPTLYTAGDVVKLWLFPLHSGEAFGLPGRMMILILGLMPSALFLTGFIRWRHTCRSQNMPQSRQEASRATKESHSL